MRYTLYKLQNPMMLRLGGPLGPPFLLVKQEYETNTARSQSYRYRKADR